MKFFSYFRLRTSQLVLCLSLSLPVATLLTVLSAQGTWSGTWFYNFFTSLMALFWGGIALYTRRTDRIRRLDDSPETVVTVVSANNIVVTKMKQHQKAQLIWEVLQDDDVIRRQLQMLWRGVTAFVRMSFCYLPSVLLTTTWLILWLLPEAGVEVVEFIRACPAESLVRWAAGALTTMLVIAGCGWVMLSLFACRLPVSSFRDAFMEKVAACHQEYCDETDTKTTR